MAKIRYDFQSKALDEDDADFVTQPDLKAAPDGTVSNFVYKVSAFGPLLQRGLKPSITAWKDYDIIVSLDTEYGPDLLRNSKA